MMKRDQSQGADLYSYDVFQILLDYEINRSQRYPSPLTLLDIFIIPPPGQTPELRQAMDSAVASMLNSHLRSADIPARKGDQYLILLPTTDEKGGRSVCARLLYIFKNLPSEETKLTFNLAAYIGLASHHGGPDLSGDILVQQAASALNHTRQQNIPAYAAYSDIQ
ncbi:MAG: diguanylate cyclase [Chloroflexi bacterium]|nr:diguanylate cyclase [Chloroflexota bacterium]